MRFARWFAAFAVVVSVAAVLLDVGSRAWWLLPFALIGLGMSTTAFYLAVLHGGKR